MHSSKVHFPISCCVMTANDKHAEVCLGFISEAPFTFYPIPPPSFFGWASFTFYPMLFTLNHLPYTLYPSPFTFLQCLVD